MAQRIVNKDHGCVLCWGIMKRGPSGWEEWIDGEVSSREEVVWEERMGRVCAMRYLCSSLLVIWLDWVCFISSLFQSKDSYGRVERGHKK